MLKTAILECKQIKKSFGGLRALNGVDFDVRENKICGLIGPNGADKTTLFNVIVGIYRPDSSIVKFKGKKISGIRPHQICRMVIVKTSKFQNLFGR